jgi:signal transduction histidine kinase
VTAALARIEQLTTLTKRERELERERNRLDAFTSTVTHDLRNPLTVASGRLELLAAECDSEHIEPIERALKRMEGLIEEMIELARQGEQVGETEWIDLDPFLGQCWQTVATAAATLSVETDAVIEADRSRLAGLFENLFRNAIDHGSEDVHIAVGTLADGEGFYVADDGDGVAEADRDRIFERGYSTRPKGTGYGLAIVNEIVEAHGWTVEVTDSDRGGARFEIRGVAFRED